MPFLRNDRKYPILSFVLLQEMVLSKLTKTTVMFSEESKNGKNQYLAHKLKLFDTLQYTPKSMWFFLPSQVNL